MLDQFLDEIPGSISSFCRTTKHNKDVGGSSRSSHLYATEERPNCCGADIVYDDLQTLYKAAKHAVIFGFMGVELDLTNNHLHVDTLPRIWRVVHHGPKNEEDLESWLSRQV